MRTYAIAVAAVFAAWLVRWLLDPIAHFRVPYATFFVAVVFAGWRGGLGPALAAVALGAVTALYWFVPPGHRLFPHQVDDWIGFGFFVAGGAVISAMSHAMHVAEARAHAHAATADARRLELERENAERRQAEAEARSQREWFRITLGSIGDGVIATDTGGNVTFLNPVSEQLTGWTLAEARGRPLRDVFRIVNEITRVAVTNPAETALREGRVVGLANHTILIAKDGTARAIDDSAAPILDESGTVTGVVLIFRDVTERRRREREGAYLAAIVSSSDDAIYGKTLDGVITSWNGGAERLYGWSAQEIVGESVSRLMPADRAGELVEIMAALRAGRKVDHFETVRCRKDGAPVHVSLTVSPIRNREGELIGASSVARDVTARKELEEELRRSADALRVADRRKDEFLATLAHELRNPLAPIRNALEIMRMAAGDGERLERARSMMERQVHQMVRLIDDLLDVSRISSGRIGLRKERIELNAAIESAIETSRPLIEAFGHELDVKLPSEPLWVDGDLTRLSQVFANLLNNAAKYTDHGRITLRVQREDGRVAVHVKDTGVGIPPDALPYIFEMFSQVDRSLERTQGGLGIGLSLARGLLDLHGGTIDAHSEGPGRGSEFVVRLPLAPTAGAADASHGTDGDGRREAAAAGRRVLIVDDNRDSADSLAIMLGLTGIVTRTAYDGHEAVETARSFAPHAVLLDIGLPGLNGYEVARSIRSETWGRDMLLVAMTGWGQDEDKQRALEAGFDQHMTKPLDLVALEKTLAGGEARARANTPGL